MSRTLKPFLVATVLIAMCSLLIGCGPEALLPSDVALSTVEQAEAVASALPCDPESGCPEPGEGGGEPVLPSEPLSCYRTITGVGTLAYEIWLENGAGVSARCAVGSIDRIVSYSEGQAGSDTVPCDVSANGTVVRFWLSDAPERMSTARHAGTDWDVPCVGP